MCAWLTCTDPYGMAAHTELLDPIWPLTFTPSGKTARQPQGCAVAALCWEFKPWVPLLVSLMIPGNLGEVTSLCRPDFFFSATN